MLDKYAPLPNQRLELTTDDTAFPGTYVTRLEEITADGIVIVAPYAHGEVVPLRVGSKLSVVYARHPALYSFDTIILERLSGGVPRLLLQMPEEIVRIQRRQHVRMPCRLKAGYAPVPIDHDMRTKIELAPAEIIDIAAGGARVSLTYVVEGIELGSYIRMRFKLPDEPEIVDVKARIVRIERIDGVDSVQGNLKRVSGEGNWRIAVEFTSISQRSQDMIMRFVFDRERELIRKGLTASLS